MTLLVTGGTGFVLSHVVRQWLERDREQESIVVDRAGFDASAELDERLLEVVAASHGGEGSRGDVRRQSVSGRTPEAAEIVALCDPWLHEVVRIDVD